jgi:hypothetical protein
LRKKRKPTFSQKFWLAEQRYYKRNTPEPSSGTFSLITGGKIIQVYVTN